MPFLKSSNSFTDLSSALCTDGGVGGRRREVIRGTEGAYMGWREGGAHEEWREEGARSSEKEGGTHGG